MCSYLLIGFWFTRPIKTNACQKEFVTNCVGNFGLLLKILDIYWITDSLKFRHLFQIINNLISKNEMYFFCYFVCLLAILWLTIQKFLGFGSLILSLESRQRKEF